jgi:hypothetical protein
MSNSYTLVNPIVVGNLNTTVEASNNTIAAKELYERLSKYFNKTQKSFIFTIKKNTTQSGENNDKNTKFYSFKVSEVGTGDDIVYTIARFGGKVNYNKLQSSINKVSNRVNKKIDLLSSESIDMQKTGGAKKDSDSEIFDEILNELDEEDEKISRKQKNKYKSELVYPYFYVPTLVDPISYYWYSNIYDVPTLLVPSLSPTLSNARIIINLSP